MQLFDAPPVLTGQDDTNSGSVATQHDTGLLDCIAQGDCRALETLYLRYHPRLTRFLWRVTPRYEDVEEIINDTFVVVWQRGRDFRGASEVSTWIMGIAYRLALKSVRHQQALLRTPRADVTQEAFDDPMQVSEMQDWMARALSLLPLEQRLTVELVYHMGHSLQEIAEITDCPLGTVKARMFHARAKLRQYLPVLAGSVAPSTATDTQAI
jgi:RNA polymerase sigma-70 factor (ECF subfamily)